MSDDWFDDADPDDAPGADGDTPNALGAALRAARQRLRLSQDQLARRSGVGQGAISRLERGQRSPSWAVFCRLLDAMEMEPVVSVRPRSAAVDDAAARLRPLTPQERLATQHMDAGCTALADLLAGTSWAVDGNAALLAHGVPATVEAISVAITDDDHNLAGVLDRLVRRRIVEVGGATATTGTSAFPVEACAEVMRDVVNDELIHSGWPIRFRLAQSLDGALAVTIADQPVPLMPVERARPDDTAATAALERWAVHVTLDR